MIVRWFSNLGLRAKLLSAFGVVLVLMVSAGGFVYWSTIMDRQATQQLQHDYQLLSLQNSAHTALAEMESAYREFMVSGGEESLQAYDTAGQTFRANMDQLEKAADQAQLKRWQEVDQQVNGWQKDVVEPGVGLRRAVTSGKANLQAIAAYDASSASQQRFDSVGKIFGQAGTGEQTQLTRNVQESSTLVNRLLIILVLGTPATVLVALGVALMMAHMLAGPVSQVSKAADGLTQGNLDQDIDLHSRDELGTMADAFRRLIAYMRRMAMAAEAIAEGDLTQTPEPQGDQDVLGNAFMNMTTSLRNLVGQIQTSAITLTTTSQQLDTASIDGGRAVQEVASAIEGVAGHAQLTSQSAQSTNEAVIQLTRAIDDIAGGANEQARQVQAASATATQMAAGVQEVAANADTVASASQKTKQTAQSGAQAVQDTVAGMQDIRLVVTQATSKVEELGRLGDKIGAVIETIDDIAEQTNLLALNAAIEAARAGEHGAGFAVVADEVRKLAERSQRETKAIADLIQEVQIGTKEAVQAMEAGSSHVEQGSAKADQAGKALTEILQAVETTVQQVNDIAVAAQEMASSSGSVVEAMQAIHTVVEQNSAATEEMAAQATQVLESVRAIAEASEDQSDATKQVSGNAEEMSAQVEQISAQARQLAATAEELKTVVARFKLDDDDIEEESPAENVISLRPVA